MSNCRLACLGWVGVSAMILLSGRCRAQGPTIEETGIIPPGGITTTPGSLNSLLGLLPGSSGVTFGTQPGRDDLLLGRIGTAAPRVPTAITMPGGGTGATDQSGRQAGAAPFRTATFALWHT